MKNRTRWKIFGRKILFWKQCRQERKYSSCREVRKIFFFYSVSVGRLNSKSYRIFTPNRGFLFPQLSTNKRWTHLLYKESISDKRRLSSKGLSRVHGIFRPPLELNGKSSKLKLECEFTLDSCRFPFHHNVTSSSIQVINSPLSFYLFFSLHIDFCPKSWQHLLLKIKYFSNYSNARSKSQFAFLGSRAWREEKCNFSKK